MATFEQILTQYREQAFSEQDKGARFERLMQNYLLTDNIYSSRFRHVWLWAEFPYRAEFGGKDVGIDIVCLTHEGDYWAVQCKCYRPNSRIDKPKVDTFLSTSGKIFHNEEGNTCCFSHRLWIDTTEKGFNHEAEMAIRNQQPAVSRIGLSALHDANVDWDQLERGVHGSVAQGVKHSLLPHQQEALLKAREHYQTHGRGKMIMACGTGKTFTSLRIAEDLCGCCGRVLFLVPSIALLGQTLREWHNHATQPLYAICICSDPEVSKSKKKVQEDADSTMVEDLALPASTHVPSIVHQLQQQPQEGMMVVFSTYQSIEVIAKAQKAMGDDFVFDLIVCDEAHRTTGAKQKNADRGSDFTAVHDNSFLRAKRRLYMTATPRIFSENAIKKAEISEVELCSMDEEELYGNEFYRIGFGKAVELGLLSDYKVMVLALSDKQVPFSLMRALTDGSVSIEASDVAYLVGCINALSKKLLHSQEQFADQQLMRRAVAFCQTIETSKGIRDKWNACNAAYRTELTDEEQQQVVSVCADHVDGTMGASLREQKLSWLKAPTEGNECRVLCNVRCLSEGVDVPSLDAVLFLSARNSQVDVVQSVGRVMRRAPGKEYGYIIIPVIIPSDESPEEVLNNNDSFAVVWSVLNALRAHDDRFNATVNHIELNKKKPNNIIVDTTLIGRSNSSDDDSTLKVDRKSTYQQMAQQLSFDFEGLQDAIYAVMVKKVGSRKYREEWVANIAEVYKYNKEQIVAKLEQQPELQGVFNEFVASLQYNLNPSINTDAAVDLLAQHIVTQPVFEALFEGYSFAHNNPVSQSMQRILDALDFHVDDQGNPRLQEFYESIRTRAKGIDNAEGKQTVIKDFYDKFFKKAVPVVVEQLGIVYTPVEVVDFIIHSVGDVLQQEFGRSLSDEGVNIIDPFTGTGTFITRLLQVIRPADLVRKYTSEIFANEIMLLAYYIASINIENTFHDLTQQQDYTPFNGICLTDTFQLTESRQTTADMGNNLQQNSARVEQQRTTPIQVVIGNPPYSVGQKSANDNAQNLKYPELDKRVAETYGKSDATSVKALYNSSIKAFRWASDRLDGYVDKEGRHVEGPKQGVIGFITNSGWIEGNGMDALRKCFEEEFASVYVYNLRGAIRGRSGIAAKREGQNVFDIMTGVAITILVKKPHEGKAVVHYGDIGESLDRKAKLDKLIAQHSIVNVPCQILQPNEHHDWINQRNNLFGTWFPIEAEKKFDPKSESWFLTHSLGVASGRDPWVYNYSKQQLEVRIEKMIEFYNQQRMLFQDILKDCVNAKVADCIVYNPEKISWNDMFINDVKNNVQYVYKSGDICESIYRPFCKQKLLFSKPYIQRTYQQTKLFPTPQHQNLVICVSGVGVTKDFSCIITDLLPDLVLIGNSQCFPLYYYEKRQQDQLNLFNDAVGEEYVRHEAVSDFILRQARECYGNKVSKEDIFYYVYGFLHCPTYRELFAADLKKMLPRIPLVDTAHDFYAFSEAGRQLADLHLNYETVAPYSGVVQLFGAYATPNYRVSKMRFADKHDKSVIIYNDSISIEGIPAEAYQYVVNGKSAIEWVMERYQVTTDTKSQITNDPNEWASEHHDEKYIFNLLLRVINVSLQTMAIVNSLPPFQPLETDSKE